MSRDFYVNGESMVFVKGQAGTGIATLQQLGLCDSPIRITLNTRYLDIITDSWGPQLPVDVQYFLSDALIQMTLVHFDPTILAVCINESQASVPFVGFVGRAGTRMGNNRARFAVGNSFIGLNIASPVQGTPWRFYYAYLVGPPFTWPLGTERSLVTLNWRAIAYTNDPWGGGTAQPNGAAGTGSYQAVLFDNTLDT